MNPRPISPSSSQRSRHRRPRAGVALVLVLASLALLSVLVVGLLVSARQEVTASAGYTAGSEARLVSETAVNMVMAQLSAATKNPDETWISQPGLLRTFNSGGQVKAFKLYSSDKLIEDGSYDPAASAATEVPADWYNRPIEFADLNKPVAFQSRLVYPIVDPGVKASGDPTQLSVNDLVQGFSYNNSGVAAPAATGGRNELPMPVRWLYILPTGEIVSASNPDRVKASARIAFWADDECSKVNVNTASAGVFFDTPAMGSFEDYQFGRTEPIAQEYQRWPGHPSTTSIASVLKPLRDLNDPVKRSMNASALTPRIGWGGSKGGVDYAWITRQLGTTDLDRLFVSTDELSYSQTLTGTDRTVFTFPSGASVDSATTPIDKLRFFITAQSRAPELNMFNRPRVSLWPFNLEMVMPGALAIDTNKLTPEDRLIQFASELGGATAAGDLDYTKRKRFYFQRKSAWNPTVDWTDIPENQALFRYLRYLTAKPIPGKAARAGASLESKFGVANRDQVLTEMWDYIRSNVNTVNQSYQPVGLNPYSFPQGYDTQTAGFNDIVPLKIDSDSDTPGVHTKGFGRWPVLTQVTTQFVDLGESLDPTVDVRHNDVPSTGGADSRPDFVIRKVRMILLLNFQMPVAHLMQSVPRFQISVTGAQQFNFSTLALNTTCPEPIQVRHWNSGEAWSTSLTGGMGFPQPTNATGFRQICYADAYQENEYSPDGGNLTPVYAMFAPLSGTLKASNIANNPWNTHGLKILSNRTSVSYPDDVAQQTILQSARGAAGVADCYYPFVSDVIEFRLPQTGQPNVVSADPLVNRDYTTFPLATNGKTVDGYDYFEATLQAGTLDITMWAGLSDAASALSPISGNWQTPTSANQLMKTSVPFSNMVIPLPRLGTRRAYATGAVTYADTWANYYNRASASLYSYQWGRLMGGNAVNWVDNSIPATPVSRQAPQIDVFRSYVLTGGAPVFGDVRVAAAQRDIPASWWAPYVRNEPGNFWGMGYIPAPLGSLSTLSENGKTGDPVEKANLSATTTSMSGWYPAVGGLVRLHGPAVTYEPGGAAVRRTGSPATVTSTRQGSATVGDFSLGYGNTSWGALIVGPDLGAVVNGATSTALGAGDSAPYFDTGPPRSGTNDSASDASTNSFDAYHKNFTGLLFSPFKQVPSPVVFGTLPGRTGDLGALGSWETLLFCPNPAGGKDNHFGWKAPRDHFFLDLFYMPAVEPFAITENFASAGKVNLNYQIAPFTYIKRKTALYALLDWFTADARLPSSQGSFAALPQTLVSSAAFRSQDAKKTQTGTGASYRKFVDVAATLDAFENRFNTANDPFVSGSEICEMFLVPTGSTSSNVESFWADKTLTGDDKREAPYNALYPRVTTKSNTFRVHFWVETLNPATKPAKPIVTGQYRGSTLIERYLDPGLTTYGGDIASTDMNAVFPPLNDKYRFRKIENHQFAP